MSKTLKNTLAAVVAASFLFMGSASASAALTSGQIDSVLSLLENFGADAATIANVEASLSGGTPTTTTTTTTSGSSASSCTVYGLPGVMGIQKAINQVGAGNLTVDGVKGPATVAATRVAQQMFGVSVDGNWWTGTQAGYAAYLANNCDSATTTTTTGTTTTTTTSTSGDFDFTGEEGEIVAGSLKIRTGDDDEVYSDTKDLEAFTFEVEAEEEGSDVLIERIDLTFAITGDETKGYKVIDAITIEVDGDSVAKADTDSKSDWRGSSDDMVRLSDVDVVIPADDTVEFSVMLDLQELDLDTVKTDIMLTAVEVRYIDGAGITNYEETTGSTKTVTAKVLSGIDFDLDENNDNPDDETISLNEDMDGVVAFVNDLEIDDESGTIEDLSVLFTFSPAVAGDIDDLVSGATLMIDGDSYSDDNINAISGATFTVDFDLGEMDIEIDDKMEISVELDFNELDASVPAEALFIGAELKATSLVFVGEDSSDDSYTSAAITVDSAPEMNISAGSLLLDDSEVDGYNEIGSDDLAAITKFTVDLKADGDEDMRVNNLMFMYNNGVATATVPTGYTVTVKDSDNDAVALTAGTTTFATAYDVNEGSTETFIVTVVYDNTGIATGEYELELDSISWTEDTADNGFTSGTTSGTLETSLEADPITLLDA